MRSFSLVLALLFFAAGVATSDSEKVTDSRYEELDQKLGQVVKDRIVIGKGSKWTFTLSGVKAGDDTSFREAVNAQLLQMKIPGLRLLTTEQAEAVQARRQGGYIGTGLAIDEIKVISADGIRVTKVEVGSTAEDAGLREGDLILAVNGVNLSGWRWSEASEQLFAGAEGSKIKLTVRRGSEELVLDARRDPIDGKLGIEIELANPVSGFRVSWVRKESPSEKAGVREEDLLQAIDGQDLQGWAVDQVREKIRRGREGSRLTLSLVRARQPLSIQVTRGLVANWYDCVGYSYQSGGAGKFDSRSEVILKNLDWRDIVSSLDKYLPDTAKYPGCILNLRGSSGDDPEIAARLAARFVHSDGVLLSVLERVDGNEITTTYEVRGDQLLRTRQGRSGSSTQVVDERFKRYLGKLVVLVDDQTQATGEAIALILQKSMRASVVGFTTAGRSTVTSTVEVGKTPAGEPVVLQLPAGQLFGPDGTVLGAVTPDRRVWFTSKLQDAALAELKGEPWWMDSTVAPFAFLLLLAAIVLFVRGARKLVSRFWKNR